MRRTGTPRHCAPCAHARRAGRKCRRCASSSPGTCRLLDALAHPPGEIEDDFFSALRSATLVPVSMRVAGIRTTGGRVSRWSAARSSPRFGAPQFCSRARPYAKNSRDRSGRDRAPGGPAHRRQHRRRRLSRYGRAWPDPSTMREPPCISRPNRNALISPRPLSPPSAASRNVTSRDVQDHPIRVGEGEGAQIDLAAEVHDEARLRLVAAEPRRRSRPDTIRPRRRRRRPAAARRPTKNETEESPARRPDSHRLDPFVAHLTPLGTHG